MRILGKGAASQQQKDDDGAADVFHSAKLYNGSHESI